MMLSNGVDALAERVVNLSHAKIKNVHFWWEGGLIVNGKTISFFRILTLDRHCDFVNNFAETLTIEVLMDTRAYYTDVLTNIENLQGFLTYRQMGENSTLFVRGGTTGTKRYKVFALNPPTKGLGSTIPGTNQVKDPDLSVTKVVFQLVDETALQLRYCSWTGMLELTEPMEALQLILDGVGNDCGTSGLQRVEADIKDKRQILIPRNTLVKDLGHYLQKQYGIYNHGLGQFVFNNNEENLWFVYPLFNNNRYQKEYFKMNIFVVPEKYGRLSVPRTYYIDDGKLVLYTSETASMVQQKATNQLSQGTGIQVINTIENRGENINEVGDNQQVIDGKKGLTSFDMSERKDGYKNYIQVHGDDINMANLRSRIVGNEGQYLTIQWTHANPNLLYPGLPVKVDYLDGNIKTLYGTLHEFRAMSVLQGDTMTEQPYACNVMMKIYVTENPNVGI